MHSFPLTCCGSVSCGGHLCHHRIPEAVAFAVHLKNVTTVREAIQQCGGHAFALEDLSPIAKGEVAGDQQAGTFVTIGENLEQQFSAGPGDASRLSALLQETVG